MKKFLLSVTLFMIGLLSVEAGQVNEQQARLKAETFLVNRVRTRGQQNLSRVYMPLETLSAMESTNDAPLYAFNLDGGGYVVVSGDDRTADILMFSDKGHLDINKMPANMKSWMEGYVRKIQHLPANAIPRECNTRAASIKEDLAPKLKTAWGQDWPYNLHTPELQVVWKDWSTTVHAATGCVATAMAQLMNYYRYPDATQIAVDSYTGTSDVPIEFEDGARDTVQVDWKTEKVAAGALIDWANITDNYDENSTDAQLEAISRLMQYCGASANMQYGMESSARTDSLVYGLYDMFGYHDVYLMHQMNYDVQGWIDALYNVIAQEGPLLFGGDCPDGYGGHQFILDGYRNVGGVDYFYVNWGWDGEDDGYITLDVMRPGWLFDDYGNEIGFTESQVATPGMGSNGKGIASTDKKLYCDWFTLGDDEKTYTRTSKADNFEVEYAVFFSNYDLPYCTFQLGIGLFQDGDLKGVISLTDEKGIEIPLYYYLGIETEGEDDLFPIGSGLGDGTYQIKEICRLVDEHDWKVCRLADDFAVTMIINGNTATFGYREVDPSGMNPVTDDKGDATESGWYSLSGQRFNSRPSVKGIYIQNGRKVVIK